MYAVSAQPVDLGGDTMWKSLVVGPEGIPVITDVDAATREPQLAVLSVWRTDAVTMLPLRLR